MTNKILMVGVLDVPSSTNVFMAKGFEALGYEVDAYNYRTRAKELGNSISMWTDFKYFLAGKQYDLMVFCKTNTMHPELLDHAKQYGPTWYWFMDPIDTAKACTAHEYAKYATYASATSSEVVTTFEEVNKNSYHIIEGYDPDIYFYEDLEKIYDITFIGNATPKRTKDIFSLSGIIGNKKIHIFGSGWSNSRILSVNVNPPVCNEEERRVINQSKIVLNLCQDDTIFSDRVLKSLGCGAKVLSQECKDFYFIDRCSNLFVMKEGVGAEFLIDIMDNYNADPKGEVEALKLIYSWKAVCKSIMEKVNGK